MYAYDDLNRTLTITQPSITAGSPVTVQAYNSRGLLASLTDPNYNTTTWAYDGAGRVVSETNALSQTRTYAYDGASQLVDRIDRSSRKRGRKKGAGFNNNVA